MQAPPFTEDAGRVLVSAATEAKKFRLECIRTEHLLIGLLQNQEGTAARILRNLGNSISELEQTVKSIAPSGTFEDTEECE
jgi:ATP-dependent Clp protease ATP-binding subunit ClpC